MKAFVDSREPGDVHLRLLKGSAKDDRQHDWEEKELPQGDFYLPEHGVVVERKEASDFASSTTDGRLSEQADRMVAEHDHVFVIVEGSPYNLKYSDINSNSVTGMQTSLAVKRGIKIIYTESISDTCWAVNRVFERFADEEHKQSDEGYVNTTDTGEVDDVKVAMLTQVQGISSEKAKIIQDEISIRMIGSAIHQGEDQYIKQQLQEIDGVGSVLAQRVIDAFQ